MYSRQCTPPQRVTSTPHSTPGPQLRPSAPIWPALAPILSDRASRDLGRRTRRAMHTPSDAHPRVRIPNTRGRSTYLDAQRAQQPRYNRLPCAHMHGTAHASDALPTRYARAASRSAAASRTASRQSYSLNGLCRGGCEWGTRAPNSNPMSSYRLYTPIVIDEISIEFTPQRWYF